MKDINHILSSHYTKWTKDSNQKAKVSRMIFFKNNYMLSITDML